MCHYVLGRPKLTAGRPAGFPKNDPTECLPFAPCFGHPFQGTHLLKRRRFCDASCSVRIPFLGGSSCVKRRFCDAIIFLARYFRLAIRGPRRTRLRCVEAMVCMELAECGGWWPGAKLGLHNQALLAALILSRCNLPRFQLGAAKTAPNHEVFLVLPLVSQELCGGLAAIGHLGHPLSLAGGS
jgi:hypothetical protein